MKENLNDKGLEIWTVGHSTRSLSGFLELLHANEIEALADVRRHPGSRKYPHFDKVEFSESLGWDEIEYELIEELGGRRRVKIDSPNTVWRNESFRGYADHMETEEFKIGVEQLLKIGDRNRTAIMCAEAVWWRCHRALISDHLKASGVVVKHIISLQKTEIHPFTSAARIVNGNLFYGAAE